MANYQNQPQQAQFRSNDSVGNGNGNEENRNVVRVAQGLFSRRRGRTGPRNSRVDIALRQVDLDVESIAYYKERPFHDPNNELSRPMQIACRKCIIGTYAQNIVHPYHLTLGVRNLFTVDYMNKSYPFYMRAMSHIYHYCTLPQRSTEVQLVDPTKINYNLLQITNSNAEKPSADQTLLEKLVRLIAIFPPRQKVLDFYLRMIGWIYGKLFGWMFHAVLISNGEVELLDAAQKSGLPIVFVPLWRSKWDPFIISWTLMNSGIKPSLFITPHNMLGGHWFRKLIKLFGGICYSGSTSERNLAFGYPELGEAFAIYFSSLLKKGSSVMLFIEPHRSRSGVISTCLIGSEVVGIIGKLHSSKLLEDVCFVPISVNYDIIPDKELLTDFRVIDGSGKRSWGSWLRLLFSKQGLARVSVCQPYRLREFTCANELGAPILNDLRISLTNEPCFTLEGNEYQWMEEIGSVASNSSLYGEVDFLGSWNPRKEHDLLFYHLAYDAQRSSVFMSTQVVSFLLLHKFNEGVDFTSLIKEFDELVETIRRRFNRDVGFTGKTLDVIKRTIDLFGASVVTVKKSKKLQEPIVCPSKSKESRIKLAYYANPIVSLFISDGIVATALLTIMDWGQRSGVPPLNEQEAQDYGIREVELVRESLQICELLKGEFYMHSPCTTTYSFMNDHNDKMQEHGFIQFIRRKIYVDRDEDEDYYAPVPQMPSLDKVELILEKDKLNHMKFCSGLVTQYLQLYGIITKSLKVLVSKGSTGMEEKELRKYLYDELESLCDGLLISHEELITENMIRNYLLTLWRIGILDYYASSSSNFKKMIFIIRKHRSEEYLGNLAGYLFTLCGQEIHL